MTKGTTGEDSQPKYSQNWMFARRGFFLIYSDKIICGDWIIHFKDVRRIIKYKTRQMFIPFTVLHIITDDLSYQFGFNPWAYPEKYLTGFNIEEQTVRLKYSKFSIIYRIILLIGIILYFIIKYFK
jgi:hypothetical protein